MIKYLFVIFYLRVVIVFEGGTSEAAGNYAAVAGMSDQPN